MKLYLYDDRIKKGVECRKLLVIIGEISENIDASWNIKYAEEMNELLLEISQEFPYYSLTPAKDLELKDDGIHFSLKSYRTLGVRYFEKYLEVLR